MRKFLGGIRTVSGNRDGMFGFGFDSPDRVWQTRGDSARSFRDFSTHLLGNRVDRLKRFLRGKHRAG